MKEHTCIMSLYNTIIFSVLRQSVLTYVHMGRRIQSTPSLSKSKGLVFSFEITQFCYKGSNICAIQALGENIHFDISGHFVICEFD